MRRSPLLAALATALTTLPAVAATDVRPAVRLLDRTPVTVTGRNFQPGEAVRVRLAAKGRIWTQRALTGATGGFRAKFTVSLGRCESLSLQAFGSTGSRARLFVTAPQPDCTSND